MLYIGFVKQIYIGFVIMIYIGYDITSSRYQKPGFQLAPGISFLGMKFLSCVVPGTRQGQVQENRTPGPPRQEYVKNDLHRACKKKRVT